MNIEALARELTAQLEENIEIARREPSGTLCGTIDVVGIGRAAVALQAVRDAALREAIKKCQGEHDKEEATLASTTWEQRGRNAICLGALRCRDAIRALLDAPAEPTPDPTAALARLFAVWAPTVLGTTAPYSKDVNAALDAGLLSGSRPYLGGTGCELTDLGLAVLALAEDGR
jgi:hypothetical protein